LSEIDELEDGMNGRESSVTQKLGLGWVFAAFLTFAMTGGVSGQDEVTPLLKSIPRDVNAASVIRVRGLLESPRGTREDWAGKSREQFLAGAAVLPPATEVLIRASHLQPGHPDGSWSVALLKSAVPINMQQVAEREKATVQDLHGSPAVLSPRNCYFVKLEETLIGVVSPAFRQTTARWVQELRSEQRPDFSPYLQEALTDPRPQVILAADLQDLFEPDFLKARVEAASSLKGQKAVQARLTQVLSGLRGIRMVISVEDLTMATLRLDFDAPLPAEAAKLKGVLLDVMADAGSAIEEFDSADGIVIGSSFQLTTELPDEALRRVVSLITAPHPASGGTTSVEVASDTQRGATAESRRYFQAVNRCLDDLQKASRKSGDQARIATWFETFGRKIDQLPTAGVDPELLAYGGSMSAKLQALGASLRGVQIEVNALQQAVTYNMHFQPGSVSAGWWSAGYQPNSYNVTSNLADVREKQATAVAGGAKQRAEVWSMISQEREKIRRRMIEKYGVDLAIGR
jgi:hypothetical protein